MPWCRQALQLIKSAGRRIAVLKTYGTIEFGVSLASGRKKPQRATCCVEV
jgi:hypothetical protein